MFKTILFQTETTNNNINPIQLIIFPREQLKSIPNIPEKNTDSYQKDIKG